MITLAALLAACGGGGGSGGGSGTTPPVGGGSTPAPPVGTPTPVGSTPAPGQTPPPGQTPTPVQTPTPSVTGTIAIAGVPLANSILVFTCGCNGDAGKMTTDANGGYTITGSAPSVTGNGTYTASGHNLMIVGYAGSGTQAWTMQFLGATPAHDMTLGSNTSDTASAAAALYVDYSAATQLPAGTTDQTFDWFNFNTIAAFAQHLRTSPTANEQKLLTTITNEQAAGHTLYPGTSAPRWDPNGSKTTNATITSALKAVQADGLGADQTLPTPCPAANQCTNAPTP